MPLRPSRCDVSFRDNAGRGDVPPLCQWRSAGPALTPVIAGLTGLESVVVLLNTNADTDIVPWQPHRADH